MNTIPEKVNPIKLAHQGHTIEGVVALARLPRLQALLNEKQEGESSLTDPAIDVMLQFGCDDYGYCYVHGDLHADLELICQRCNQPMTYRLVIEFNRVFIYKEADLENLPEMYDPLITHGEKVDLFDMVDEEILLNLPIITKHKQGSCPIELPDYLK